MGVWECGGDVPSHTLVPTHQRKKLDKLSSANIVMLLVNVLLGSIGQVLIKYGVNQLPKVHAAHSFAASMAGAFRGIFTPYIFLGFCVYAISSVLWIRILTQVKLSVAYPTISLSYVIIIGISALIFHEKVPWIAGAGVLLICIGVSFIGIGNAALK
jgi:drug/metabolite transporter (DMT)-like permease